MATSNPPWEHDIFLSYNRRDAAAVERLAGALEERELSVFKDDWYLQPGAYWPSALERKLNSCAAIVVAIGRHGLGPWQQREVVAALDRHDRAKKAGEPAPPVLPLLLEDGSDKQAGLTFLMQNVWVEGWDPRAADLIKGALDGTPPIELYSKNYPDPRRAICPYRGLQVFREEDAAFYFGREPDVDALASAVARHPVTAVVGPSGSGKSSLARAGLLPRLRRARGEQVWQFMAMMPGRDPFRELADQLLPLREPERYLGWSRREIDVESDDLMMRLERDGADHLARVVEQILEEEPGTTHLLLLVDQWEEIYTERPSASVQRAGEVDRRPRFINMILDAVRLAPLQLVLTLRADYWGEVLNDARLAASLHDSAIVHLRALDRGALAKSVRKPAEQTGLDMEDALSEALLNDAEGQPGDLPLLEFALQQIFAECSQSQSGVLTLDAYRAMGSLAEAIVKQADKLFDHLDENEREAVPGLFTALVQVGEQRSDLRRRARLGELSQAAQAVARRFADARLLVTSRDHTSGEELVEVAHEALLRHWPKLEDWIDDRRDALLTLRQLQADCRGWLAKDRASSHAWSHERAREAAAALAKVGGELVLSADETAFLGPIDPQAMLEELDLAETTHHRRQLIGERLDILGDPRKGIGLAEDGTPDFVWQQVAGGETAIEVLSEPNNLNSPVAERLVESRQPFRISRYPVTVAQYRGFIEASDGWCNEAWWADDLYRDPEGDTYDFGRFGNHAAVYVSWFDALAFCRWASQRLNKTIGLPDEWQWQLAANGGEPSNVYPWGVDWDPKLEPFRANSFESRLGSATAVGMYPGGASTNHAFDMGGTVFEWALSKFETPTMTEASATDFDLRVLRGGSWADNQDYARCAARLRYDPNFRNLNVGFRVVCSSPILGTDP
jgi:formylglycine-generating enzyme required for sulfatase activity/energy-coupling factor transporter ATP-binding protein EcfA2